MVSLSCLSEILQSLLQRRCCGSSKFRKLCTRQISLSSMISIVAAILKGDQDRNISNSEQRKLIRFEAAIYSLRLLLCCWSHIHHSQDSRFYVLSYPRLNPKSLNISNNKCTHDLSRPVQRLRFR